MPDGQGESPPGSLDKVLDGACFVRNRTGGRRGFGFDDRPRRREGASPRPDAERPDFGSVVAGSKLASIRAAAGGVQASARTTIANGPTDLVPAGCRGRKLPRRRPTPGHGRGLPRTEPRESEALWRFRKPAGKPLWLRPRRRPLRLRTSLVSAAIGKAQRGTASRPGDGSPDWDSGGWWRHQPPFYWIRSIGDSTRRVSPKAASGRLIRSPPCSATRPQPRPATRSSWPIGSVQCRADELA